MTMDTKTTEWEGQLHQIIIGEARAINDFNSPEEAIANLISSLLHQSRTELMRKAERIMREANTKTYSLGHADGIEAKTLLRDTHRVLLKLAEDEGITIE